MQDISKPKNKIKALTVLALLCASSSPSFSTQFVVNGQSISISGSLASTTANDNKLYLRNMANTATTIPSVFPELPDEPGGGGGSFYRDEIKTGPAMANNPLVPIYRQEVSLMAALPSTILLYDKALLGNLHQRGGETFNTKKAEHRKWLRYIYNDGSSEHNGTIYGNGPNFDYRSGIIQLGADLYNAIAAAHHYVAGIFGAIGNLNSTVDAPFVRRAGYNHLHGISMGGYFTYTSQERLYLDAVVQGTRYDVHSDSIRFLTTTEATTVSGSLEAGYRLPVTKLLSLQPQAQVIIQGLSINKTQDVVADIQFGGTNPLASRVGLLGEYTGTTHFFDPLSVWLRANYWYQGNHRSRTYFSSVTGYIPFYSSLARNSVEAEIGFNAQLRNNYTIFGTLSKTYFLNDHGNASTAIIGLSVAI